MHVVEGIKKDILSSQFMSFCFMSGFESGKLYHVNVVDAFFFDLKYNFH